MAVVVRRGQAVPLQALSVHWEGARRYQCTEGAGGTAVLKEGGVGGLLLLSSGARGTACGTPTTAQGRTRQGVVRWWWWAGISRRYCCAEEAGGGYRRTAVH